MPNCWPGVPWNSAFRLCSKAHTTAPVKTKKAALTSQRSAVRGLRKIQAFLLCWSLRGTTMETPETVYGKVKSTNMDRLAVMVTSPTTASYF